MKNKPAYRIRNWREYDTSLRCRGSLSFWISQDLLENWTTKEKTGERGASPNSTDAAIETLAVLKYLFRPASRQAQGMLSSIFELRQVSLPVPDHTTLSRRLARLDVRLPVKNKLRNITDRRLPEKLIRYGAALVFIASILLTIRGAFTYCSELHQNLAKRLDIELKQKACSANPLKSISLFLPFPL